MLILVHNAAAAVGLSYFLAVAVVAEFRLFFFGIRFNLAMADRPRSAWRAQVDGCGDDDEASRAASSVAAGGGTKDAAAAMTPPFRWQKTRSSG